MPYFDEAGIKAQETKEKNNIRLEDNSTSNDVVNESMLRQKLKNLVQKEFFSSIRTSRSFRNCSRPKQK